jgi:nitrate reductase gamma subunit
MYRAFGYTHAALAQAGETIRRTVAPRLRGTLGQGTVEYVALILLVALVMAGVVAALKGYKTDQGKDLGDAIVGKIKDAVDKVKF